MAIGARILSDNLSGKTADVTFLPLSGGTINVGSQTVPFNYFNTYPYGTYQLYFAEYDYTYEVVVPDPTPLEFILESEYTPGSIVAKYTLTSNVFLNESVTATFDNVLGVFVGSDITISTGVTISKGSKVGETIVTLGDDFNNLDGNYSFSEISGLPSGSTYVVTNETPNKQSTTYWVTLTGGTTLGAITFAFGPLTAQTIDFGLEQSSYYKWDLYPLTNRGYMFNAMKTDYTEMTTIFVDAYGNEVDRITLVNNNLDYDDLDGIYGHVTDVNNGTMYYFDGFSAYTFNWDNTNYPYFSIDWDYYAVTSNNSFIIKVWNDSDEYKFYLINKGTPTLIDSYDSVLVNKWYVIYPYSNFIIRHIQSQSGNTPLTTVEILELDGVTVRRTIDLSSGNYNSYNYNWFSESKFVWLLWDNTNLSSPYRIMNYDGVTDTLNSVNFGNQNDYPNRIVKYNDKFYPSDTGSDSFFIFLYENSGSEWYGWPMNRCQIFYMLSGQTTFSQYNFNDTGVANKYLYPYSDTGNNLFLYCSTGGTDFSVLSITQSGTQITQVAEIGPTTAVGQDQFYFGDRFIQQVWKDDTYTNLQLNLFNQFGVITDTLDLTLGYSFERDYSYRSGIFYFTDYTNSWWLDENTNTFQQINNRYYSVYPDSYYSPDGYREGVLGLWRESGATPYFRILSKDDGITNEWTLPNNNGSRTFRVGRTNFLYTYEDEGGFFNWVLYDFSGNPLQSLTTSISTVGWSVIAAKDRYTIMINDGVNYTFYGISNTGYLSEITGNSNSWDMVNDYIWWD